MRSILWVFILFFNWSALADRADLREHNGRRNKTGNPSIDFPADDLAQLNESFARKVERGEAELDKEDLPEEPEEIRMECTRSTTFPAGFWLGGWIGEDHAVEDKSEYDLKVWKNAKGIPMVSFWGGPKGGAQLKKIDNQGTMKFDCSHRSDTHSIKMCEEQIRFTENNGKLGGTMHVVFDNYDEKSPKIDQQNHWVPNYIWDMWCVSM